MQTRKTPVAARELGISYWRLVGLLRAGLEPPAKDSSGDYLWPDEDIQRARDALAAKTDRKQGVGA
jgi:hypothetical protein